MSAAAAVPITQIVFWLGLSAWIGAVLFVAIATPIIFKTVRDANPILPTVLSVNLEGQHGALLAASIVADVLAMLQRLELACAGAVMLAMIAQRFVLDESVRVGVIRWAMFAAAVGVLLYDWLSIMPRLNHERQVYLSHADEPEIATASRTQFDRLHQRSVGLLSLMLFLLLGLVLFSASLGSRVVTMYVPTPPVASHPSTAPTSRPRTRPAQSEIDSSAIEPGSL